MSVRNNNSVKFLAKMLLVPLLLSTACSNALHRTAVYAESGLRAGSQSWDVYTDGEVAICKDRTDPIVDREVARVIWDECVAPTKAADEKVAKAMTAAVTALRMYWAASAADDREGMLLALRSMRDAVMLLPDEQFGGVKKILKKIPL